MLRVLPGRAKFDANFAAISDAEIALMRRAGRGRNLRQIPARFLRQKPLCLGRQRDL